MAELSSYVTDHPTKYTHINKYPPRPRRVLACTTPFKQNNNNDIKPRDRVKIKGRNEWLPQGYAMAQQSAHLSDMCPHPHTLTHPPDRYLFPECSARLFAFVTVMKDDTGEEEKHWIQAQRDLSLVGICPPPTLYTWLPDTVTHPDCDICIAERLRATQSNEWHDFFLAQQECSHPQNKKNQRNGANADPEGMFLSGSCPSVRVVRWVPSGDVSHFHDCQQAIDRWCRDQSPLSSTRRDDLSDVSEHLSHGFLETSCSTQWRSEDEFHVVVKAQRWAANEGLCPYPDSINGLSFMSVVSGAPAFESQEMTSYFWDQHRGPPKRREFSTSFCSLLQ